MIFICEVLRAARLLGKAMRLDRAGQWDEAEAALRAANALLKRDEVNLRSPAKYSTFLASQECLGRVLMAKGDFASATRAFEEALAFWVREAESVASDRRDVYGERLGALLRYAASRGGADDTK
jgi:tetratricopeptide (TPR) repeat protein